MIRRPAGRKCVAAKPFGAKFQEDVRRREPTGLYPIIAILTVQKGAIGKGRVGERPVMRMALIQVSDAGKHPSGPECDSLSKSGGLDIGLLDIDGHVVAEREIQPTEIIGIDIGGEVFSPSPRPQTQPRAGPKFAPR